MQFHSVLGCFSPTCGSSLFSAGSVKCMTAVIRTWSPSTRTRRSRSQRNLVNSLHRSRVSVALMVKNKIAGLRLQSQITYSQNKQIATNG